MFFLVNLTEVNGFALKEEACMSNIKFLADVGRLRPRHTETAHSGGQWRGVRSTRWALLVRFAEANVPVLLPGFLFVRCWILPSRVNRKTAGWVWAHLVHLCLVPHGSALMYLTSLQAPTNSV